MSELAVHMVKYTCVSMEVQLKYKVQNTGTYRRQLELSAVSAIAQHGSPATFFVLCFRFRQE
jgi:hypothetical protein